MTLTRITSTIGAVALAGLLVSSTYVAPAAGSAPDHFQAPVPHKYGANGMRMGLHCETTDMS
jgi:hypothetical protein